MKIIRKPCFYGATVLIALLLILYAAAYLIIANLSITTHGTVDLTAGNIIIPTERKEHNKQQSSLLDSVLEQLVSKQQHPLVFGNKEVDSLIAHLAAGKKIEQVNRILQQARPWGEVGSFRDYDFTLCGLTLILYTFGDQPETLYPATIEHIVNTLMTEKDGDPAIYPLRRGLSVLKWLPLKDTENHILMTEGSRFLTNQWITQSGSTDPRYDNTQNGLESWLLAHLEGIHRAGLHEYNSIPYEGYTLRALLNLASFAKGPVKTSATQILDRMTWTYALGSLNIRRYAPFRRSSNRASETNLKAHYQTAMMKIWGTQAGMKNLTVHHAAHHAMWAGMTSYQPPDAVIDWLRTKPTDYFVKIGHGNDGSPEIYSGGPGYLITAGGVANDFLQECVARPTTLMLEDEATDLNQLLHVKGLGNNYRHWNNTGVHHRFAVAAGPVFVPEEWIPAIKHDAWSFYNRAGKHIAVYSSDDFGLFCLLPDDGDLTTEASALAFVNANPSELKRTFKWPSGSVLTYDVSAKKSQWIILSYNSIPLDRDHRNWPLMSGTVPEINSTLDKADSAN